MSVENPLDVRIVGGEMFTNELILPSIYHLQRTGVVGGIAVCALNAPPLRSLKQSANLHMAFPFGVVTGRRALLIAGVLRWELWERAPKKLTPIPATAATPSKGKAGKAGW